MANNKITFKDDINHLSKYGIWPQTWDFHKNNLLKLSTQVNREFQSIKFKPVKDNPKKGTPGGNNPRESNPGQRTPYQCKDKVTSKTSDDHKKDFLQAL